MRIEHDAVEKVVNNSVRNIPLMDRDNEFTKLKLPINKIAFWSAWVICPVIILFSYMPFLNQIARGVFIVFICWFFFNLFLKGKKQYSATPILFYLMWGAYALCISVFALDIDVSIRKWVTVFLLGLVSLAVSHAVVWGGGVRPWGWAYVVSVFLSIISNYLPIQSYLAIDYQTETLGRTVGTFGNANTYGRVMVQGSILAVILMFQESSKVSKILLLFFLGAFGMAVLQSGSRTAFVGYVLVLVGAVYSVGWAAIKIKNLLVVISFLGICGTIVLSMPERFTTIFERMNILLSYIGLVDHVMTKERSLEHRKDLMDSAWSVWLDHPWGVGLDNYQLISGVYAHSNYFELLASVGLLGLILYYCSYWSFYRRVKRAKKYFTSSSQQKMILVFVGIMLTMDISNVSYYSKPLWLLVGILCGHIQLAELQYKARMIQ